MPLGVLLVRQQGVMWKTVRGIDSAHERARAIVLMSPLLVLLVRVLQYLRVGLGLRVLPPSLKQYRFRFSCHKFNLICRKYVEYLCL